MAGLLRSCAKAIGPLPFFQRLDMTLLAGHSHSLSRLCRGMKTNVADLRKGDWIEHDGKILVVQSVASAHSGRGARHFLVLYCPKMYLLARACLPPKITTKEAMTNQVIMIKPNPRDDFEKMEMNDASCQFMYQNGDDLVLTNTKTLEEYSVPSKFVDPNLAKLLEGGTPVKLRLSNGRPIMVSSGASIKCTVASVVENREMSDKRKNCLVEVQGGARVSCSVQVSPGEAIMVNVDDLSYACRA